MWSKVGTLKLGKGENHFRITELKADAEIDAIFMGLYPPFSSEARASIPASEGKVIRNTDEGSYRPSSCSASTTES